MMPFTRILNYERFKRHVFLKHLIDEKNYTFGTTANSDGDYLHVVIPISPKMTDKELDTVKIELNFVLKNIFNPDGSINTDIDALFDRYGVV